jgi:hypothetical protein
MRVRSIVPGIVLVVLGLAAIYWFNTNLTGVTVEGSSGRRTWVIKGGDTVKLSADQVGPDDRFRCEVMAAPMASRARRLWVRCRGRATSRSRGSIAGL